MFPEELWTIIQDTLDKEVQLYKSQTFASSTKRTYKSQLDSYLVFCEAFGYCAIPASTGTLCRYAAMLARSLRFTSIKQYLNVVRILHRDWDLPNPLADNFQLSCTLRGIRRALGDSVSRKLPINPQHLLAILSYSDMSNRLHVNIWAAALVMFFAMLRRGNLLPVSASKFNPMLQITRKDIVFTSHGLIVTVRGSKTIQFQQRQLQIPIPRIPGSVLCPAQAVYRAFKFNVPVTDTGPAFVSVNKPATALTSKEFITHVHKALRVGGLDPSVISGHSFRRGGASWAYQCGISVDTIRIIGDWKSNAYTKYIIPSDHSLKQAMSCFSTSLPMG